MRLSNDAKKGLLIALLFSSALLLVLFSSPHGQQGGKKVLEVDKFIVITVAGSSVDAGYGYQDSSGYVEGPGLGAQFNTPTGITVDNNGIVYVADSANNRIRKVDLAGTVSTYAGNGERGTDDGIGLNSTFSFPYSIAFDHKDCFTVAESDYAHIRRISKTGYVSTLNFHSRGSDYAVAHDTIGNLYIVDSSKHQILRVDTAGHVSTFAGSGTKGDRNGPGSVAQFSSPKGITVDCQGNVYVADSSNHRIRKVTSKGLVSTLAGNGETGYRDGPGIAAQFYYPTGVAVDNQLNVFVVDTMNNSIRKVTPEGYVYSFAGSQDRGYRDGPAFRAQFNYPTGIAVDPQGSLFVSDTGNNRIRKIIRKRIQSAYD